ncbi:WD repeat protein [Aspergillus steynii IBT 23096]|uniref:WD repeat protein n=1 Tax=Aspergillus steynii IBT 23096 TaxID=1392250 RepID=A0A2I2GP08_9EURO|nr:WD repeat protein [Aspergillus steynii IBT 23096]PLB54614.1 WD repeat protein [Aspergillus steynii IBT 23096]
MSNPPPTYDPRRATMYSRQPEELHIPSGGASLQRQSMSHEFATGADNHAPSINFHPTNAQPNQFGAANNAGGALPGALQPGNVNRPPAMSVNTAPSVLPTLPQLSTPQQQQQQPPPQPQQPPPTTPRSGMTNSHGHSRSSPAGVEQSKYKPHGLSETARFGSSPGAAFPPVTPQGAKYSPLGLSDIRPSGDLLNDQLMSPGSLPNPGDNQVPTNSNYIAPWPIYAVDWCKWPITGSSSSFGGKLALGSYLEDNHNYIQIIDTHWTQPDPDSPDAAAGEIKLDYVKTAEATHSYPVTRILWEPPSSQKQSTDLLATSGDHLRLWSLPTTPLQHSNSITRPANQRELPAAKLSPLALLSNSKSPEHTAPITSLDWNTISPSLIITSSIDTTCTIWDIPTLTAKTQLIAHDKEVYDVRFCANSVDVFVSCGADGSVRMFDLRSLEHSTIIYEPTDKNEKLISPGNGSPSAPSSTWPPPLLRIAASPHDAHLLATFSQDSNIVRVLDVRQPGQALLELKGHAAALNSVEWSPNRRGVLASGADDCFVLLWDLINQQNAAPVPPAVHTPGAPSVTSERGPAAAWKCDYEVSNISWSPQGGTTPSGHPRDWLGVCGGRGVWGVAL